MPEAQLPEEVASRASQCDGKQRFDTFSQAERVAKRKRSDNVKGRQAYRCQHCHGFHIGSRSGGANRGHR